MDLKDVSLTKVPGVGPLYKKKFEKVGINTVVDILLHGAEEIHVETGMKKDSCDELIRKAKTYLEDKDFIPKTEMTPREILEFNENRCKFKTGSKAFDDSLNGGFEMGQTYSIYGQNGSGKTQVAHNQALEAIYKRYHVLWIELENTFRPERIIEMAIAKGYAKDKEEALDLLDRVIILRGADSTLMMDNLSQATPKLIEKNVGLIIVDGGIGKLRIDFRGRQTLSERQVDLGTFVGRLAKLAYYLNICVIITNQVTANLNPYGALVLPIGGHILGHFAQFIIYIRKSGDKRIITLKKSSYIPENDANIVITAAGIEDTTEVKKQNEEQPQQQIPQLSHEE